MKCDRCDNEATVHELLPKAGGKTVERHLCESCAKQAGVAIQTATPITQILSQYLAAQQAKAGGSASAGAATQVAICRACGVSYAHFRQTGLLGCPDCYKSFEAQLAPMLQRAHEGGVHHVGKSPSQAIARKPVEPAHSPARERAQKERAALAADLRRKLAEAIAAEQYELAAQLRDELGRVERTPKARARNADAPGADHGRTQTPPEGA